MVTFISNKKMPDGTPWYFTFNHESDNEPIIDSIEFENEDEQEEEDFIVDPYYFCVRE